MLYQSWKDTRNLQHLIDMELFIERSHIEKLEYQKQQHSQIEQTQKNAMDEINEEKITSKDRHNLILERIRLANVELQSLQAAYNGFVTRYEEVTEEFLFLTGKVNILRTNIASIKPRLVQEEHTLKTTTVALLKRSNHLHGLNKEVCFIKEKRDRQLIKSVIGALLWHKHAQATTSGKTAKVMTAVKDFTVNIMISSAFDYFNVGGYITSRTKSWFTVQAAPKVTTILNKAGPSISIAGQGIQENLRLTHVVTTSVAPRKESWFRPLTNIITNRLGRMLTSEQKINIAVVKRNTLLRELQCGWRKAEIMDVVRGIGGFDDLTNWVKQNGYEDIYDECQKEINERIG